MWTAIYGVLIDTLGEATGVPLVFVIMGISFIAAALTTLPIRTDRVVAEAGAA